MARIPPKTNIIFLLALTVHNSPVKASNFAQFFLERDAVIETRSTEKWRE